MDPAVRLKRVNAFRKKKVCALELSYDRGLKVGATLLGGATRTC